MLAPGAMVAGKVTELPVEVSMLEASVAVKPEALVVKAQGRLGNLRHGAATRIRHTENHHKVILTLRSNRRLTAHRNGAGGIQPPPQPHCPAQGSAALEESLNVAWLLASR